MEVALVTLRDFLVQYRKKNGLSQRQFAEQCGLSNGYISMLESGKNPASGKPLVPKLPALAKIAAGMGIPLTALLEAVDNVRVENESAYTSEFALTSEEIDLVIAYRGAPDQQNEVRRLLGLPSKDIPLAALFQWEEGEQLLRVADGTPSIGEHLFGNDQT